MKRVLKISLMLAAAWSLSAVQIANAADKGKGHEQHGQSKNEGKHDNDRQESGRDQHDNVSVNVHFGDDARVKVRDYYQQEFKGGRCPPGLAKKNNGCMPPGQARKWQVGHALPSDVVYYDLPPALVVQIGVPPSGSRYVRVASDILLIAIGTSMVIDAIDDLDR